MEVKNQVVDQMLVNTVAQAPANQNTKAPKDADRPDFDSMVQKRSAEKDAPKAAKTDKAAPKETTDAKTPAEEAPVTDEQYAIAAAMMFQAQPDVRVVPMETEAVEAAPEVVLDAAQTVDVDATVGLPETQVAQEGPVEAEAEFAPELTAQPEAQTQRTQEISAQSKQETEAAPMEAEDAQAEKPELEQPERQPEQAPRMAEENEPRTERAARNPDLVRDGEQTEDETGTDNVPVETESALFDRVDTPVVKVAEASKPIPLEAADGIEQLGDELGGVIVNSVDANRVEIQLTPENLGKLTVEITRREDGTLNVVLHTESQRAAGLLEKGADGLRQALAANRQQDVQIEVRGSEETQERFLNPDGQNEQNRQQQQQQQNGRRNEQRNAQDFLQQLRLGLVDVDDNQE